MKLDEQILNMIRVRVASPLSRPSDFEVLAADIEDRTGEHIGVNTLKRLFGLIGGVVKPTGTTLDIVARYLGFENYQMLLKCNRNINSGFGEPVDVIFPQSLEPRTRIEVTYQPSRLVRLNVRADHLCSVEYQENTKLQRFDLLDIGQIVKGAPFYVRNVVRNGESLSSYTGGREGGVTSLNVFNGLMDK